LGQVLVDSQGRTSTSSRMIRDPHRYATAAAVLLAARAKSARLDTGTTHPFFVGPISEPGYLCGANTLAALSPAASKNAARYTLHVRDPDGRIRDHGTAIGVWHTPSIRRRESTPCGRRLGAVHIDVGGGSVSLTACRNPGEYASSKARLGTVALSRA
jgi:hypothetical protein